MNGHQGGGNQKKNALLTKKQALFIATLSRNTEQVIAFKAKLVASFAVLAYRQARAFLFESGTLSYSRKACLQKK
jgi:phage regulator Rha-like protein